MSGPLSGIRVLDFTRLLPGPFGTMMLADLGADVLRVESKAPDLVAIMPPMDGPVSAAHRQLNRGKRSITVDLKNPAGCEVVKKLVATRDVVVEQFRPGVMERLCVGYDVLKSVNPRLIYCSITGYGQDGPYRDRAGHDIDYLALSGVMAYTGRKESGPAPLGIQVADQCAGGMNAVIAVLAAIIHRERTGQGQYIDISMTDGSFHLGTLSGIGHLAGGGEPRREEQFLNGGGYYDFYETRDGEHMAVGGLEPQFFAAMVKAMGREDLLECHGSLGEKGAYLKSELKKEFASRTRGEWEKVFAEVDACVEPVLKVSEAMVHPLFRARGMLVEVEREDGSKALQIGSPHKFSATPCQYPFAGVRAGAHTRAVLVESGFTNEQIDELIANGAVVEAK